MTIPDHPVTFRLADGRLDVTSLFMHYSKPLFYYALKFVDDDIAKDIVQDVFLKLWANQNITVLKSLNGFLFAMVRNGCLQQIEKQKVRANFRETSGIRLKEQELLFYSTESSSLIELELQEQLKQAIASLPDKCRQVFILSRLHDKMNKEIADELGISIKTVEKHITHALRLIRPALKDYLPFLLLLYPKLFMN